MEPFLALRWQDLVDILLITLVLYRLYVWIQGTRALRILIALAGLGLLYFLARWAGLFITTWILQYLWAVILVIAVVIFQSEIRQVLERMSPLRFFLGGPETLDPQLIDEVVRAAFELAQKRIGALIVFQREDILSDHLKGGISLEGRVSYEVLSSIFIPTGPAHDGAVIIHGSRILSVSSYLPLSDNSNLPRNFGTRHRAGIGITERTDALSLIISEERGEVRLAMEGRTAVMPAAESLRDRLKALLGRAQPVRGKWQTVLTRNLAPKIVSFALVLAVWGLMTGQQRAELWLTIPLEYRNMPPNMQIAGDPTNRVEVGIRGPRGIISAISPDQVRAHIDLSRCPLGANNFHLTAENIRTPLGAEIIKINPGAVRIRLEEVKSRSVPVRAHLVGRLPALMRLKSVLIEPSAILLQGPESTLEKVQELSTEQIDLSQVRGSGRVVVGVEINSPYLRLAPNQPSKVNVDITIEKES